MVLQNTPLTENYRSDSQTTPVHPIEMINKGMNKPYFYKIKHKATGKYYVGSQYGKRACKENFFVTYFTSSKCIIDVVLDEGVDAFEIVSIIERDDARAYESYYLQKCYRLLGKDKFLDVFYNRTLSPGIILDETIIAKQTETKRNRWANGIIQKPTPPDWKGKRRSERMKQRLSQTLMGHAVSDETRQKLRDANLGKIESQQTKEKRKASLAKNKNSYGRKHWLFVSPDMKYYYTLGKRNIRLHELGLSEGSGFFNYLNTNTSPRRGKNSGWLFYEGEENIKKILDTVKQENIIQYE